MNTHFQIKFMICAVFLAALFISSFNQPVWAHHHFFGGGYGGYYGGFGLMRAMMYPGYGYGYSGYGPGCQGCYYRYHHHHHHFYGYYPRHFWF